MAKKKKEPAAAKAPRLRKDGTPYKQPTNRKKGHVRKYDELMQTPHGKIYYMAKSVAKVGEANGFSGTDAADVKSVGGWTHNRFKEGAPYWSLSIDSPTFQSLVAGAKDYQSQGTGQYTEGAKQFINAINAISSGHGGGGGKSFNHGKAGDVDLNF